MILKGLAKEDWKEIISNPDSCNAIIDIAGEEGILSRKGMELTLDFLKRGLMEEVYYLMIDSYGSRQEPDGLWVYELAHCKLRQIWGPLGPNATFNFVKYEKGINKLFTPRRKDSWGFEEVLGCECGGIHSRYKTFLENMGSIDVRVLKG